jgi:hypothetical protein
LIRFVVATTRLIWDALWLVGKIGLYLVGATFGKSARVRCWLWNRVLRHRSIFPMDRAFLWLVGKHDPTLVIILRINYQNKIERTKQVSLTHYFGACCGVLLVGAGLFSVFLATFALLMVILVEDKQ